MILAVPTAAVAQSMIALPQNRWLTSQTLVPAGSTNATVQTQVFAGPVLTNSDELVFVEAVSGVATIAVHASDGTFIRQFACNPGTVTSGAKIAFQPPDGIVVWCGGSPRRYSLTGVDRGALPSSGTVSPPFAPASVQDVETDSTGRIYIGEFASTPRVIALDAAGAVTGSFSLCTGTCIDSLGWFAILPDNRLLAVQTNRTALFDLTGRLLEFPACGDGTDLTYSRGYVLGSGMCTSGGVRIAGPFNGIGVIFGQRFAAVTLAGDVLVPGTSIARLRRSFRAPLLPAATRAPFVEILNVRPGVATGVVEIVVVARDSDSPTVDLRLLAFTDESQSLAGVVVPTTFADGTGTQIGPGTPVNTTRTVRWNAAADLGASGFRRLTMEALASDGRPIVDLMFSVIPANVPNGGDPELSISRIPMRSPDLLSAWFWLLATRDARIALANGTVSGTAASGAFNGVALASASSTTTAGEDFLYAVLGVRRATPAELSRAQVATTPGLQAFLSPLVLPGLQPAQINEIGVEVDPDPFFPVPAGENRWVIAIGP